MCLLRVGSDVLATELFGDWLGLGLVLGFRVKVRGYGCVAELASPNCPDHLRAEKGGFDYIIPPADQLSWE